MDITEEASCRVCLGRHRLTPIFKKRLAEKIKFCASVQLSESDELPKMICNQCTFYLDIAYIFRTVCEATDARLRQRLDKQNCEDEVSAQDKNAAVFFINEVIIGDEDPDEEINLDKIEDKPKVGRHTAKKNSAKCPKRVPPKEESTEPRLDSISSERKLYQCDKCSKSFPYKSHLVRHSSVHSMVKKYRCPHCHKDFVNGYNLRVHVQKHTGNFPLQCKLCERGFPTPSLLKRHLNSHLRNAKFQCKDCPKKFLHLSSLKLHEKMHVYRPCYTCDICFKTFAYMNSLNQHKKIHGGVKENVCDVCGKEFTRKTSLRRHMVLHSVARKVKCYNKSCDRRKELLKCDECCKKFTTKSQLVTHLQEHIL